MKKILLLFIGLGLSLISSNSYAQSGDNCANAAPFCTGTTYTFPNNTGIASLGGGGVYGCLGSTPNPVWYFMEIATGGNLDITINQTAGGSGSDVDFICWGPFANQAAMCPGYSAGNIIDCSYSTAATEVCNITGATAGQFYLLLLTNYANTSGTISFTNTGGTATTNCAILCNMTALTATPSACNPATGQYSVSGQVTVTYPPTTGTLTLTSSCGGSVTLSPPFTSPISYTIPGITANGAACSVTGAFSADATCTLTTGYTAPASCTTCTATASNTGPYCSGSTISMSATGGGTYSWAGPGGFTSTSANPTIPTSTTAMAGTYTVTVTVGAAVCTATTTVAVTQSADPTWTQPAGLCILDAPINLDTYVTGTAGGTWSGTGVTGNTFNPAGLSGSYAVTYSVGTPPCNGTSTLNIAVTPNTPPTITPVAAVCSNVSPFNVTADLAGGTWSGPGITNAAAGTFDPSVAGTSNQIIYTLPGSCSGADTITIAVTPSVSGTWTLPAAMCANNGPINLDSLVTGATGGAWSGTGVTGSTFNPSGLSGNVSVTYIVGASCPDTVTQDFVVVPNSDATWNTTTLCQTAAAINLDALVTGTAGGTWTGTGVTGSSFDPAGLSGTIAITYTVGTAPCVATSTQNINVVPLPNASWTTTSMCSSATVINLDSLITGTTGGTWSGTGVTGNSFNPSGLSGAVSITYTVGSVGCQSDSTQDITVTPASNAAWTTTTLCAGSAPINLTSLVTGTAGGTWSGTGVTGTTFDPAGLSGAISVTYTVGTAPCVATSTQTITVTPVAISTWTTTSLCANATPINLNTLVTGTTGGTWSGVGVTGSTFNPSGLSGNIAVTYTVGTAPCASTTTQNIVVTPNANATISPVSSLCATSSAINLTAVTPGGTWSGTGITNASTGTFSPASSGTGTFLVTYTVAGACGDTDTILVTVNPNPSAAWTLPALVCENGASIDLNTLVTGVIGGTWSGAGVTGSTFDPTGLTGNTTITYSVTQAGCSSTATQTTNVEFVDAAFTASPTSGMAPVLVSTTDLSTNANTYLWNFDNGATSTLQNPSTTYTTLGNYTITQTVTSVNGCVDVATLSIHVDQISLLVVPNIFTPNGDNVNEIFKPIVAEGLSDFKAVVYDRWGLKMHEWTDASGGWDGKSKNGNDAPDGTYYYVITGKGVDGKSYDYNGFVQLLREH